MINNKLRVVIAVMIIVNLLVIASSVYVYKENANDYKVAPYRWISSIYGNVSVNEPYTIILPIPLNILKGPMYTEDEIFVLEGNVSFNYTDTKHGLGIEILSSGDFILELRSEINLPFVYYSLSKENITRELDYGLQSDYYHEYLFWAYGNFTSPNNELEVKMGTDTENSCVNRNDIGVIYDTISNGWQNINGKYMRCYAH